ncbi:ThiF family adenylyltransferase [Burkholderia sp. BCC1638]|uniref:ThiF family adenylyltransferase n=1 Tax=Burkholderia sp. BCC1638 TaxID=2681391 RepID=UPI0015885BBE|nr:ThiF family adenylyltransferase [Burkholderia sp. BCC1638]
MDLIETLNRTMKLAMDDGRVASYEEAKALFESFKLRIHVQPGFTNVPAAQAAVLTLLNAAPKTFLGGVELTGAVHERCTMAWFAGQTLGKVAQSFGAFVAADLDEREVPTIYIGNHEVPPLKFSLGVILEADGFTLSPDRAALGTARAAAHVGVAAAGAALSEAFLHAYRKAPLAGQRDVRWRFPSGTYSKTLGNLWLVGLGHLGQAFLWTAALAGDQYLPKAVKLSDFDNVSNSSLSTCLLVNRQNVGHKKVDVIAERLEALGVQVERNYERLDPGARVVHVNHELFVVAVDNVALRRSLDRFNGTRVLEAGIGNGVDAFTRIQVHAFPGPRKARDIWADDDAESSRAIDISKPAYQSLLAQNGDRCGTTLLAGRSVATPFVGAFAGAILFHLAQYPTAGGHAWSFDIKNL